MRSAILARWNDDNDDVRAAVVDALSNIASRAEDALVYLEGALRDPSHQVRYAAANGVSHWAASAAGFLPMLHTLLADKDNLVVRAAIATLFQMPQRYAGEFV